MKSVGDPWDDFGYYLEVLGFITFRASKFREWDLERTIKYAEQYIRKAANDYEFPKK